MAEYPDEIAWIWLSKIGRPVNKIKDLLKSQYGSIPKAFEACIKGNFTDAVAKNKRLVDNISDTEHLKNAEEIYKNALAARMRIIHREMPEYPALLNEIPSSPTVIYCYGLMPYEKSSEKESPDIHLSMVGARNCSSYGFSVALRISRAVSERGVGIISGMARGIDTASHRGAIESGGYTAAVLGCGCDVIYPAENSRLYNKIRENGCIISEYPPGTPPLRCNFPARNRIVAGLSPAVTVIEAGNTSGAMITAGLAADMGRDVFAVPGNIDSLLSCGCNGLIQNGALCVTSPEDILRELGLYDDGLKTGAGGENALACYDSNSDEYAVYNAVKEGICDINSIGFKTGIPYGKIQSILVMLEVKKVIEKHYDGLYFIK